MTVEQFLVQLQLLSAKVKDLHTYELKAIERINAEPPLPEGLTVDEEYKEVLLWY